MIPVIEKLWKSNVKINEAVYNQEVFDKLCSDNQIKDREILFKTGLKLLFEES